MFPRRMARDERKLPSEANTNGPKRKKRPLKGAQKAENKEFY